METANERIKNFEQEIVSLKQEHEAQARQTLQIPVQVELELRGWKELEALERSD